VSDSLDTHLRNTKQALIESAGPDRVPQVGAEVVQEGFPMPTIDTDILHTIPSIETFVVNATDRSISPTGTNSELNKAWLPAISAMGDAVFEWLDRQDLRLEGDAYITASITPASDVSGDPHFDDDQFVPTAGVGVVAIVADRAGSRVATEPIEQTGVRAPLPLVVSDQMKAAFDEGMIAHDTFAANTLVVFPQFGQLHAGPGPCGSADDVRHLLVFRAATTPAV
jgi:hypothetical protein